MKITRQSSGHYCITIAGRMIELDHVGHCWIGTFTDDGTQTVIADTKRAAVEALRYDEQARESANRNN